MSKQNITLNFTQEEEELINGFAFASPVVEEADPTQGEAPEVDAIANQPLNKAQLGAPGNLNVPAFFKGQGGVVVVVGFDQNPEITLGVEGATPIANHRTNNDQNQITDLFLYTSETLDQGYVGTNNNITVIDIPDITIVGVNPEIVISILSKYRTEISIDSFMDNSGGLEINYLECPNNEHNYIFQNNPELSNNPVVIFEDEYYLEMPIFERLDGNQYSPIKFVYNIISYFSENDLTREVLLSEENSLITADTIRFIRSFERLEEFLNDAYDINLTRFINENYFFLAGISAVNIEEFNVLNTDMLSLITGQLFFGEVEVEESIDADEVSLIHGAAVNFGEVVFAGPAITFAVFLPVPPEEMQITDANDFFGSEDSYDPYADF